MTEHTDRELLELAAKAAGYRIHGWIGERLHVVPLTAIDDNFDPRSFDPLNDDADALRLAVNLKLSVKHGVEIWDETSRMSAYAYYGEAGACHFVPHCDDPYAATRRAIVLAAAAIAEGDDQ